MDQIDFSVLNLEEIDWDDPDFEEISSFDLISGPTRAFKVNVETFLQENQNQNTKKKKRHEGFLGVSFVQKWSSLPRIYSPRHAEQVYMWICLVRNKKKKGGSEYEPTTVRGFISSLDRHLKEKKCKLSIINDIDFEKKKKKKKKRGDYWKANKSS